MAALVAVRTARRLAAQPRASALLGASAGPSCTSPLLARLAGAVQATEASSIDTSAVLTGLRRLSTHQEMATVSDAPNLADLPMPQFIYHTKAKMSPMSLADAIRFVQDAAAKKERNFNETIDLAICLGTNPKRGDQMVRSSISLPHGTGSEVRVGVFAPSQEVEAALAAGADVAGNDDLISHVQETGGGSKLAFDKCIATPDMMKSLSKVARILGPRGMMPNPKLGTIVQPSQLPQAIKEMKQGRVEFRADKGAVIHVPIGKVKFSPQQVVENAGALIAGLLAARPQKLKGSGASGYILKVYMSSTMGPSVPVQVHSIVSARPKL